MSVYKRSYTVYAGARTPLWSRLLVLTRYGLVDAWSSRITNVLCLLCLVPVIIALLMIYVFNSETARVLLQLQTPRGLAIDNRFFLVVFQIQCWLALPLTAWVGPRLISADLANNALPVILSRPIDRTGYVAGKLLVLFLLLSGVTWAPGLLLFLFQAQLSKQPWAFQNWFIASGMLLGALLWMAVLSLLSLALAAWVKWRTVSTGLVFGALFVPAGVGEVSNAVLRTSWGSLLNVPYLVTLLWQELLHVKPVFRLHRHDLPPQFALAALILLCTACLMALHARVRAREVVRG